jgi:hypothetical protein
MALTTATKTLVDATPASPDSLANATAHGSHHSSVHAALKEIYGIRRYKAVVTQTSTGAPTAVVLENTLVTTPTWSRTMTGWYLCTFGTGEALKAKRIVTFPSHILSGDVLTAYFVTLNIAGSDDVVGITTQATLTPFAYTDGALVSFPICVEVYP